MPGRDAPDITSPIENVVTSSGTFATTGNPTPQVIATNGNISLAGPPNPPGYVVVAPAAAVTGITMDKGLVDQQQITVHNNSAFSVTFAAVGTSNVADGTSDVIAANTARDFVWLASASAWFRLG